MLLQIFAAWPLPAAPQCTMRLPMREHRLAVREGVVGAADHEGQRRRRGAAGAARDRRVERSDAARGRERVGLARACDIDGGAIDEQRALPRRGRMSCHTAEHMLAARQHGDNDVGVLHRRPGVCRRSARRLSAQPRAMLRTTSKPDTCSPALIRLAAIGPPMLPRPMNPMFDIARLRVLAVSTRQTSVRARRPRRKWRSTICRA